MRTPLLAIGSLLSCIACYLVGVKTRESSIHLKSGEVFTVTDANDECQILVKVTTSEGLTVEARSSKNIARSPDISFTIHDYKYPTPGVRNLTWIDYNNDRELARFLTEGKIITTLETPFSECPLLRNQPEEK